MPRYRLTLGFFRIWELTLAEAIKRYPQPYTIPCTSGMPPSMVATSLRDAKLSLFRFSWSPTVVDVDKFRNNYDDIVVRENDDGTVVIGSKEHFRTLAKHNVQPIQPISESITITLADFASPVELLAYLCDKRIINGEITIPDLQDNVAEFIQDQYDVVLEKKNTGYTML